MTNRENYLRTLEFKYPEWIPCGVGFLPLTWRTYRKDLEKIVLEHPRIFPGYKEGSANFYDEMPPGYKKGYFKDNWGCVWHTEEEGMEGQVVEPPLADWNNLATYQPPDPLTKEEREERDWNKIKENILKQKKKGELTCGPGERLFDRLYFLRGFENLMVDIATDDPHLPRLIEMLTDYELRLVKMSLDLGVDMVGFHTDIGTQNSLMISPAKFRKYIKPMYHKIFQTCRKAGAHVYLSSDGRLLEIVDDLIECGVSFHDPQLRANTLQGIIKAYKGKLCANVDLDRQSFPFASPKELRQQVKEVINAMASPEGGLMIYAGFCGGNEIPLRNIAAVCEAMEDYCFT